LIIKLASANSLLSRWLLCGRAAPSGENSENDMMTEVTRRKNKKDQAKNTSRPALASKIAGE
jgi:hypothetical protein